MADSAFRSGFIAIIGRPNAGKSTLLNQLLGKKLAIVSDKPQTTRNSIRGIYTTEQAQLVFVDTPGINKPHHKLEERMMEAVKTSLADSDLILWLVDANDHFGPGEAYILHLLAAIKRPVFLAFNKIDLLAKEAILPLIAAYAGRYDFAEIVPISAKTADNCDRLLSLIPDYLPACMPFYPPETDSDCSETFFVSELIREQVLLNTAEEIPHSVAVTVAAMEERDADLLYIAANIYVERDSQKGIIIGKQGVMLKRIGAAARAEIEKVFACRVYLDLRVKAKRDWRNNEALLNDWLE